MKAKRWMIAEPDAVGVSRLAQEKNCAPVNPVNPPLLFFSSHHPTIPAL